MQEAFWNEHGLQCGFCTPGMILTTKQLLADHPNPTDQEIRHGLEGNLCRCTGYQHIVNAVKAAAQRRGHKHGDHHHQDRNAGRQDASAAAKIRA